MEASIKPQEGYRSMSFWDGWIYCVWGPGWGGLYVYVCVLVISPLSITAFWIYVGFPAGFMGKCLKAWFWHDEEGTNGFFFGGGGFWFLAFSCFLGGKRISLLWEIYILFFMENKHNVCLFFLPFFSFFFFFVYLSLFFFFSRYYLSWITSSFCKFVYVLPVGGGGGNA